MFTNEQISEIAARLAALGTRDSCFRMSDRLRGDETIAVVQECENRNVTVRGLFERFLEMTRPYLELVFWSNYFVVRGAGILNAALECSRIAEKAVLILDGFLNQPETETEPV